jgi:DNA polymerase-1
MLTDELFDPKDKECLSRWNSGEWVLEEDPTVFWTKTDVHNETTLKAFPFLNNDPTHPQFDHYRKLGKVCNFLKNYQGGKGAIIDQLDVDDDIAEALDKAYYAAFPDIKKYQSWCTNQMYKYGFVENLYGRRYYMRSSKWFYKVSNYLVQGSCADMVKVCELRISELLEGTKSDLIMAVHDELILRMHTDDEYLIPQIKAIMEDIPEVPYVPMIADVDVSTSDWATKTEVEI